MEAVPVVLDVSSDEEEEVACLGEKGEMITDFDWINEFLAMSDEEPNEVVVLHEPEHRSKSSISTPGVKSVDDDDDCVVLDGDPENRVTTVDDSPTGSDELVVVGEKGQIACRDYPHPRHLCVKFPYSSTLHEKHCDQCHCYVCDSIAPCLKWGTGLSGTDHCHATDKSETWRTLRKNCMLDKTAPSLASNNYGTLGDVRNVQHNHILPLGIMLLSPNSLLLNQTSMSTATLTCSPVNLIPPNQASRPIIMHAPSSLNPNLQNQVSRPNSVPECSIATNFTIPSGTNHSRYRQSQSTLMRNRYESHFVPQHVLGVRNHAIQRVRGHGANSLGPQFLCSNMMLKGLGSVGVGNTLPMNHSTHGVSGFGNHVNPAQQYDRYHAATGFSNTRTCYGQNDVCVPQNFLYPHPCSQPNNLSSVNNYSTAYETQAYNQSNGSQNFYAYCVQGNAALSSNVTGLSRNQVFNEQHQIGSQNEIACGNVIQCGITRPYSCQQKPHDVNLIESALKEDFSAFDLSRIEDTSQSISCLQSSGSMNISSSAKESGAQFTELTDHGSVDDIKRWLFNEENSVPVGANELNMPSPDLSTFGEGTLLYDFENSWDCLAHV